MYKTYIEKYFNQKTLLDKAVEQFITENLKEEVVFYACYDLNEHFELEQSWIVLTQKSVLIFRKAQLRKQYAFTELTKIIENNAQSCTSFTFINKINNESLLTIHFSHRQKINFSQLKYIVERKIEKPEEVIELNADEHYSKALLQNIFKNQSSKDLDKTKIVWRLLSYVMPYKKELIIGSIGAGLTTLVSLIPAYITGYLIDSVIKPFQLGTLTKEGGMHLAFILIGTLAVTYLFRELFIWVRLKKMSVIGEKVARDLRMELYSHIQKLGMDFFSTKQTGSIISRVSSDTDRIWDFIAFGIVEVGISIMMLVALSGVLISLDWKLGLIMVIPVPVFLLSIYFHGERMKKLFLSTWRKWSDMTGVLSDSVQGIQVVKAFNQGNRETKRFGEKNDAVYEEVLNIHHSWTKFWPILMLGIQGMNIFVWYFALPRMLNFETSVNHLTAGTFVSFSLYMTMFSHPIEVIGQMARMLNRATSSAFRIFEVLDTEPSMKKLENEKILTKLNGDIEFQNVIFSYDGVRQILKGIDINVKAGEMIGLVGPSGGGKSTITKLISRFYDVNAGEVLIDGHNIKNLEIGSLREKVGMVLQEPYLFHGTIARNIAYGKENASMEEIIKAARVANAHEFILKFKDGYETMVGERGQTLSGGERQRISIARAILHDPRILILDEATSAVDTETERNIQEALDRLVKGRTVIAIAHRLSTLRKANRIIVIKDGKVAEEGSHHTLMDLGGEYKKLQDMQNEMHELLHGSGDLESIDEKKEDKDETRV